VLALGYFSAALAAYLIGSVPTGFVVGKAKGMDIRTVGSGNIGATNVFRILGKPAGILVLLADAFKGWISVAVVAKALGECFAPRAGVMVGEWFQIVAAVFAVLGHNYTFWLRFKGGKGIATSAGVLLALVPVAFGITLGIWILVLVLSRYVSLASISAGFALPFAAWAVGRSLTIIVVTAVLGALAIYKHRPNIQRLLNGTEHRFGRKRPDHRREPPGAEPSH
jgi:glycerol-3-phosphate acyltransferase PlsY